MSEMFGDVNCHMAGLNVHGWERATCQVSPGDSGSPVIAVSPIDGMDYAIAMEKGAGKLYHMQSYHTGTLMDFNMFVIFSSGYEFGRVPGEGDKIIAAIKAVSCD